jgi:ABC-type branched-subunit amino acid transport system ATPase component
VRPTRGTVTFDGVDLTSLPSARRAHVGIGRTFQRVELFDTLTVAQNVALGREARMAGASPWRLLFARPVEVSEVAAATAEALELCGIAAIADRRAGSLSTGQKRLVELARAVAGGFRMLLLDEPSSGLDVSESASFVALLREVVTASGVGVLLVEHDMRVIAGVCDHVYVLDFGELIFSGSASEAMSSDLVRAAYLGTEPVEVAG